ncbi:NAD(P)-binding protein [Paraburkholderia sp.]|uniref:NAD(P)-binding protein n=1 Tax=Paraburkholderia sp. TaxID=1926495 RepID=UPI003D6F6848
MAKLKSPTDALPLLAFKIAPRQFDVSYRFSNISLRDQIVRAQMLVRTLVQMGLVKPGAAEDDSEFQLLICGAGAAGLAAAREAQAHNVSFFLIEKGRVAPGGVLASKAPRYVSPAMYEWPHPNHSVHSYPLDRPRLLDDETASKPALKLKLGKPVLIRTFGSRFGAGMANDLASWKQNFDDYVNDLPMQRRFLLATQTTLDDQTKIKLRATLDHKVSIHGVSLRRFRLPKVELASEDGVLAGHKFIFSYVIYAVGFAGESKFYADGMEPSEDFQHTPFWGPDQIHRDRIGFKRPPSVGILGSGDGAMQDALRCLVQQSTPHPLAIWNAMLANQPRLKRSANLKEALSGIAAADGYTTGGAVWTHQLGIFKSLDKTFGHIIHELVAQERVALLDALRPIIRTDVKRVTIVTQQGYFTKAYALNRFLVLLFKTLLPEFDECFPRLEILSGNVTAFDETKLGPRGARLTIQRAGQTTRNCDLVIIRGGLDRMNPPTQLVGLSGMDTGRAELGRIRPPIRPAGKS